MSDPRHFAFQHLQAVLERRPFEQESDLDALKPVDRGLYFELVQGVLRELAFLERIIEQNVKKQPRFKAKVLLLLGSYQILFLNKVPVYAVFSSLKELARKAKFSEQEQKFLHGVLKVFERERSSLLGERAQGLEQALKGSKPTTEIALSALNINLELIQNIIQTAKAAGLPEAAVWVAVARMKEQSPLVGYLLENQTKDFAEALTPLQSKFAPFALRFADAEIMRELVNRKKAWVQGEASQWACHQATKFLGRLQQARVLEMASGKGGKLLGTATALNRLNPKEAKKIHWIASDSSIKQIEYLEKDVLPLLEKSNVDAETLVWDWQRSETPDLGEKDFDLVWIDAPCSSLGTLSKNPEASSRADEDTINELASLQLKFCEKGWEQVRQGGVLFFTVCTMTYAETFGVLKKFIKNHSNAIVEGPWLLLPGMPGLQTQEGFFGFCLRKNS